MYTSVSILEHFCGRNACQKMICNFLSKSILSNFIIISNIIPAKQAPLHFRFISKLCDRYCTNISLVNVSHNYILILNTPLLSSSRDVSGHRNVCQIYTEFTYQWRLSTITFGILPSLYINTMKHLRFYFFENVQQTFIMALSTLIHANFYLCMCI